MPSIDGQGFAIESLGSIVVTLVVHHSAELVEADAEVALSGGAGGIGLGEALIDGEALLEALAGVAARHDTSVGAIATRWILDQPAVAAVILGTGSQSRAKQNAAIGNLQLDEDDRLQIARVLDSNNIPPGDMYDRERDFDGPHTRIIKMNLHDSDDNQ